MKKSVPKWRKFEELVGTIQRKLAPTARVITDAKLIGKTGVPRQVDVVVRKNIGQYEILIVMDCKDHKDPIDIKDVEEFLGLVDDVRAQKAAMVASSGYTPAAKLKAEQAGIDLYVPIDSGDHDWKSLASIPMVCDFRGGISYRITFTSILGKPFVVPSIDPKRITLYDRSGSFLGEIDPLLREKWNTGLLPCEPGQHEKIKLVDGETFIKIDSELLSINVLLTLFVRQQLFFGHLPLEEITGFKDEIKGRIVTPGFKTSVLDVVEVQEKWRKISSLSDLAITPFMILQALDRY